MKYLLPALILSLMAPMAVQAAAGISPNGVCESFAENAVPADYKPVPSCDQVKDNSKGSTIAERLSALLQSRLNKLRADSEADTETKLPAKYLRYGSGSEIRNNRFGASNRVEETSSLEKRTTRSRNYNSRFRTYSQRSGALEDKVTDADRADYQNPGGYRSIRNETSADAEYSNTPRWTASTQNHFRERNYGTNPYSLSSLRSAEQRAYREKRAAEQRVDVKGRILSNSRRWRPGRIIGDLGGNSDWAVQQRALRLELQSSLEDNE